MKIQAIIVLSLVASIYAAPEIRSRRDASNSTTAASTSSSTGGSSSAQGVDCGKGAPQGLRGLLGQVGVLLDNLLANVAAIRIKGVLGGDGDLLNLTGVLMQVRILLSHLLGGTTLEENDNAGNRDLLASLLHQVTALLDKLLGDGSGKDAACNNNGGILGGLLGSLTDGALGTALQPVLNIVGALIKGLTPSAPGSG
ncbi:uncharacterized protein [Venturia canescens]|uniref:uncharacterized protein n=1 Tax=Venturia canescens TaxID=32260 RepID=UPI001C9D2A9B|nr:uncharacterized protein LOC122408003 [Venturia canescens]